MQRSKVKSKLRGEILLRFTVFANSTDATFSELLLKMKKKI
jgi:hypothetical protein